MAHERLLDEISRNFDYLQRVLATYLPTHRDEFALLHDRSVIGFFKSPGEADRAGAAKFTDGLYSIQQITDEAVELGTYAASVD